MNKKKKTRLQIPRCLVDEGYNVYMRVYVYIYIYIPVYVYIYIYVPIDHSHILDIILKIIGEKGGAAYL